MREYPRRLFKKDHRPIIVADEQEEYEAGLKGYESHQDPKIIEKRKGTDRDIIRENPEIERKKAEEEKAKKYNADLIEVAKKALKEDKEATNNVRKSWEKK